jgi:nitroreductase
MDALEAIAARRSVRKYKDTPVSKELLTKLVDAGRLAPTAHNDQVWEFVVFTDEDKRRQLADLADYGKFIAEAPACIVILSKPTRYFLEDGSAATTNIMLAAAALGLGTCWVAGDKKQYAAQVVALCGAPQEYKLVSLIAVGYAADIPSPKKRPVEDVLHWENFRGDS